jgi:hypothetical protein
MHPALENLCGPGKPLKAEAPDTNEIAGLLRTGRVRLHDAQNTALSLESRFDLATATWCFRFCRTPSVLALRFDAFWTSATTRAIWANTKACSMLTSDWSKTLSAQPKRCLTRSRPNRNVFLK